VNRAAVLLVRGVLIAGVLTLAGCGTPPRAQTTFLTNVDLVDMTDRMAESFARTPAIAVRTPRDAPWIISIARVANNTNQIITDNERWAYVGRLRAVLTQSVVSDRRSLVWIVPPERWPLIASELSLIGEPPDLRRPPTHLMTAQFDALTETARDGRSDAYVCSFQLVDLATGSLVWEDAWEVVRTVRGVTYD